MSEERIDSWEKKSHASPENAKTIIGSNVRYVAILRAPLVRTPKATKGKPSLVCAIQKSGDESGTLESRSNVNSYASR
jgi:hypothetical protein